MNHQITSNETQQAVAVREQFGVDLRKQITTKRMIIGGAGVVGLAVALPIAIMAVQAGAALVVVGALGFGGYVAWRRIPSWIQRHENSIIEANQVEMNRHLAALKQEARKNPVESLQNYLQTKARQLEKYMEFVSQIGGQVKSTYDMLMERKKQKPDKDYSKKDKAVEAMQSAYQFHLHKVEAGKKALADLKEAVEDAQFDWKFGQAGQSAMQNMKALEGQDLLNEMLASESFDAVRDNFNKVFSDIEVQIGTINSAKQIDFGDGIIFDVESIHIPTTKEAQRVQGTQGTQRFQQMDWSVYCRDPLWVRSTYLSFLVFYHGRISTTRRKCVSEYGASAYTKQTCQSWRQKIQLLTQLKGIKVMKTRIFAGIVLLFSIGLAQAQSLTFASGEAKKGYSKVFTNINEVCNASVPLKEVNTNGGLDNLTTLVDKGATVGISQFDTWQSLSGGDEAIGRLKAVVSLNYNLMHIIVQKDGYNAGKQCSGKEFAGKCITGEWQPIMKVVEKDTDLKGLTVAAVGSAQVLVRTYLNKKLGLGLDVKDVDAKAGKSGDQIAFEMLKAGQVHAVITMAAYPAGPTSVGGLKQTDGLILANFTQQVGGGYRVVKKNYKGLGAFNVPFLAVPNILWARPVDPNGELGQQVTALKSCITKNLKKFQDGENFEPSWADATLALPDDVPAWSGVATPSPAPKKK